MGGFSFRPLYGDLMFLHEKRYYENEAQYAFSSPLRGSYVSTIPIPFTLNHSGVSFRPLYGDLMFLLWNNRLQRAGKYSFRPLYGDLMFLQSIRYGWWKLNVFVPSTGILCFYSKRFQWYEISVQRFRPLYGDLMFLQVRIIDETSERWFSSPLRGSYVSTLLLKWHVSKNYVFVPSTGILCFYENMVINDLMDLVFVPSTGILCFYATVKMARIEELRFRPLYGDLMFLRKHGN